MTHEGISFDIRAGFGRNEWTLLMFNVLSEPQQASIKQHFDDLLKRSENVEVMGVQAQTFQRYREALGAQPTGLPPCARRWPWTSY
jgi:hypothetical protein